MSPVMSTDVRDVQFNADNNSDIKVHWLVVQNKTKRIELPLVTSLRLSHMCHSLVRNFSLSLSLSVCVRACVWCVCGWVGGRRIAHYPCISLVFLSCSITSKLVSLSMSLSYYIVAIMS